MKNIFGTQEDLKLYHKNGELAYVFRVVCNDYSWEATYDILGNQISFKDSIGNSWESTIQMVNKYHPSV